MKLREGTHYYLLMLCNQCVCSISKTTSLQQKEEFNMVLVPDLNH